MLKTLSDGTTKFVSEVRRGGRTLRWADHVKVASYSFSSSSSSSRSQNKNLPIENTTDCLSTMATVCKVMLETP